MGGQEPVQCGMCCNAAYLDQIPDDGQITDVIEARVPDEKETRGTREQLKNGIAKWSNLKFHRKYGHCGNCGKCEICTMVKGAMKRYHKKVDPHRDTRQWHTVAMDMIQFSHTSLEGNQNMICFRDEATGEYHLEFLYLKSDAPTMIEDFIITRRADPAYSHMSYSPIQVLVIDEPGEWGLKSASPPPLSQIQSVATGRDAIGSAAGAARGRRYFYMNGRGGRSRCPEYPKTIPGWPGIPQVEK